MKHSIAAAMLAVSTSVAGADWLSDANARIARDRMGDLKVKVIDVNGNVVKNATVAVDETRSAFHWGTAVNSEFFSATSTNADKVKYRNNIKALFNQVELENGHKWRQWEDPAQRGRSNATVDWANANDLRVRGHTMIWPKWSHAPDDMTPASSAAYITKRTNDHITAIGTANRGRVADWDVVNEWVDNHVYQDIMHPGAGVNTNPALVQWFNTARAAAPDADLYLNDYSIISTGGSTNSGHLNGMINTAKYLQSQNAPLNGVGVQAHFSGNGRTYGAGLVTIFNKLAALNVPTQITEVSLTGSGWTDASNPGKSVDQVKADYMRELMTAVFSVDNVTAFQLWGFWDGAHFESDAPIFNEDWTLKPAGQVYMDLVFDQWWTNASGTSGTTGQYATRGYLGDYDVTVTGLGATVKQSATLDADGTTLTVIVPEPAGLLGLAAMAGFALRRRR